jgi:hypothetical protein
MNHLVAWALGTCAEISCGIREGPGKRVGKGLSEAANLSSIRPTLLASSFSSAWNSQYDALVQVSLCAGLLTEAIALSTRLVNSAH